MKTKMLLWIGISLLVACVVAAAVWWALRPQVITFSDDAKLTLVAVDYGKKHTPPNVKAAGGTRARRGSGSFTTTNDTLVLWVRQQYEPKEYHYFQYYIYDKDGTGCVQTYGYGGGNRNGSEVVGVRVNAFPRRQGKFYVRVQEQGNGGQEMSEGKFVIRNPARKPFMEWAPESLPDPQDDGDVTVTLKKLAASAKMPYTRNNDDPDDAANLGVQATFHVERNGKPVTNWQPVSVETTDATGNSVSGWIGNNNWQDGDDTITYQYALWPDEPVWKMRFEFSQQSDFSASELWTVNVPVQPGKQQDFYNSRGKQPPAIAETDLNGFHIKMFPAKQFTDASPNDWMQSGMEIQVSPDVSTGYRMTVKITDDQNNEIQHNDYGNYRNNKTTTYRYRLQDIAGLTNLNVTVALHKSRFVEFKVKPEKAAITADAQ